MGGGSLTGGRADARADGQAPGQTGGCMGQIFNTKLNINSPTGRSKADYCDGVRGAELSVLSVLELILGKSN